MRQGNLEGPANSNREIWLVCTGLGVVNRGFEQYISSLAMHLASSGMNNLVVVSGGNPGLKIVPTISLGTPSRKNWLLALSKHAFLWEQRFFFLRILPHIRKRKPAAIYLGEYRLFAYLSKIRKLLRFRFSLALYTGGQAIPGQKLFDSQRDYVHHITPVYLRQCEWIPAGRQLLLPHFFTNDFEVDHGLKKQIRALAAGRTIVISVGLLDFSTKHMNMLAAALSEEPTAWFPVLLGASSPDTPRLRQMLETAFGTNGFILSEVSHPELGTYYSAADIFVSCSLKESFGLAGVEALHFGLPVVCHKFFEAQWVLKDHAHFVDMNNKMELVGRLKEMCQPGSSVKRNEAAISFVEMNYGWPALCEQYIHFFPTIAGNQSL